MGARKLFLKLTTNRVFDQTVQPRANGCVGVEWKRVVPDDVQVSGQLLSATTLISNQNGSIAISGRYSSTRSIPHF